MSHVTGTVQSITPKVLGPGGGSPPTSPHTWSFELTPAAPPIDVTKFVMLHFRNASFPGGAKLEVDLGYGMDVFTAADGASFWTRPANIYSLPGGKVTMRYITSGGAGSVELFEYGRGERHHGVQDPTSLSNSDPFLKDPSYSEPKYDPFWYCAEPPNWENAAKVTDLTDVRAKVMRSVGMIVSVEGTTLSTCSVTLIDADKVITAGHCHTADEALTSSITFDYALDQNGNRPGGYDARFYKVKKVLNHKWDGTYDYSLLQLAEAPAGVPIVQMRHDVPAAGEQVFGIHHPNGSPKKLSVPHSNLDGVVSSSMVHISVPKDFHVSGGSSGSGLFDLDGRICGVLSNGDPCHTTGFLKYFPTSTIIADTFPAPPPPVTRDVMIVLDRSGSMTLDDGTGRPKIEAARDAASLFVQLVQSGTGNRAGMVSFSTAASSPVDFAIASVHGPHKTTLTGLAPYAGGKVGALVADGWTSIGSGLDAARLQLTPPGTNPRAVLLMTDGLQNTPPWISQVDLSGIDVHVIGLGSDSSLDGALLNALATAHNGLYTRAADGLSLEKFFSQAFGNIFPAGVLFDPEFDLPAIQPSSPPYSFNVCGEDAITVVLGWSDASATLHIEVRTPGGVAITGSTAGVTEATGRTWTFLRIPLPHGGERDGVWQAFAVRPQGGGEFPPPAPALRYFVNGIPSGGPRLLRVRDDRRYYTGDRITPMVSLRYSDGTWVEDATVQVTVTMPATSAGNVLSQARLRQPVTIGNDTIPARQATLMALERKGQPAIDYAQQTCTFESNSANTEGMLEPLGVWGKRFDDLLKVEGNYTFHCRATYGNGCVATRELLFTLHVDCSVDPSRSDSNTKVTTPHPDGSRTGTVTITPRDSYGNNLGPGRGGDIVVSGAPGTTVTGSPVDNGDGSYTVPVVIDAGTDGGVVVSQPDRPPVIVAPPRPPAKSCKWWKILFWIFFALTLLLLWLLLFK